MGNNPINFNDPSGHVAIAIAPPLILIGYGLLILGALAITANFYATVPPPNAFQNSNMPQIPPNKNIKNSQIIASNRTPYPGYNQPPRDPKPNPILEGLQEAAKATYHFCKISLKTCLFVGGVLLSSQLIGINQDDNKPNPFHCNANPNDAACKTEPSITPTTTSTFIPTPTSTPS